jgi:hypothetical protein
VRFAEAKITPPAVALDCRDRVRQVVEEVREQVFTGYARDVHQHRRDVCPHPSKF